MALNGEQAERYSRQIALSEIGISGQERLLSARILVVGAGGLGSPVLMYLAAAGIGHLGIMDADDVDITNLQRQLVHATPDIGRAKVVSAKETLEAINPDCQVVTLHYRLTPDNADAILKDYDFVIDATDNFAGKFLITDACRRTSTPYSHAGILEFSGQSMTVIPGETACYRCVFEEPAPDCGPPRGPLGAVAGLIGCVQATEAVKYVTGCGELLTNRLLTYDALSMSVRTLVIRRNPNCQVCGGE